jgi:hypothetical protein
LVALEAIDTTVVEKVSGMIKNQASLSARKLGRNKERIWKSLTNREVKLMADTQEEAKQTATTNK